MTTAQGLSGRSQLSFCRLPPRTGTGLHPEGTVGLAGERPQTLGSLGLLPCGQPGPLTSPEASTLESAICTSSSVMSKSKSFSQSSLMSVLEPRTKIHSVKVREGYVKMSKLETMALFPRT